MAIMACFAWHLQHGIEDPRCQHQTGANGSVMDFSITHMCRVRVVGAIEEDRVHTGNSGE